jgi:hypothetical protein
LDRCSKTQSQCVSHIDVNSLSQEMGWITQSYSKHPHTFISRAYKPFMAKKENTSFNLDWCASRKWKITKSGMPSRLNYSVIIIVYTIYKCYRGPHNTTWCAAGWKSCFMLCNGILWSSMGKMFRNITYLLRQYQFHRYEKGFGVYLYLIKFSYFPEHFKFQSDALPF